jgi:hypothetical protein
MLPILIAALVAGAVLLVAVGIVMSGGPGSGSERQDQTARLSTEIARADLELKTAEFVALWIASPFVFAGLAILLSFVFAGFRNILAIALAFLIGAIFPLFYLRFRQQSRRDALYRFWAWVLIGLVVLTVAVLFMVSPSFISRMLGAQ